VRLGLLNLRLLGVPIHRGRGKGLCTRLLMIRVVMMVTMLLAMLMGVVVVLLVGLVVARLLVYRLAWIRHRVWVLEVLLGVNSGELRLLRLLRGG